MQRNRVQGGTGEQADIAGYYKGDKSWKKNGKEVDQVFDHGTGWGGGQNLRQSNIDES